jgi:hypothetical protein
MKEGEIQIVVMTRAVNPINLKTTLRNARKMRMKMTVMDKVKKLVLAMANCIKIVIQIKWG